VNQATIMVLAVGVVTIGLKASGPMLLGARSLPPIANRVMALLAPALLSALVATQAFGGPHRLVLDARAVGVGAAAVCIALRAPLLVTVVVAAAATAGVRFLSG
jgi:branched-subunit amino acid transport protein